MNHPMRLQEPDRSILTAHLHPLPADPLLGLSALYREDPNPQKVDLGVGVYKDEYGLAPVMQAVKQAEQVWLQTEASKAYIAPRGDEEFLAHIETLLLGHSHPVLRDKRSGSIQTPGGSGALRIAADFILRCNPNATLWLPNPTWVNHDPLLERTGLQLKRYPYYDMQRQQLDFDAMMACLKQVPQGDVVLLHGCCHNPTGADLTPGQWRAVSELALQRGFTPFVDIAYQGFAESLDFDAFGLRLLAEQHPVVIITASCSKNFAIYRERIGSFHVVAPSAPEADICLSQALDIVRGYYFVPPTHGGFVVKTILSHAELKALWQTELDHTRQRIIDMRHLFTREAQKAGLGERFAHIGRQNGMFSFLGLDEQQVEQLRQNHSVYMASNSRINLSGINPENVGYLMAALQQIS